MSEANGHQQLPPGWIRSAIGSLVEPRTGKANPQATPDAKFIGMEQVEPHTMRLLGTVKCGTMKSSANSFQPFDVLYGRMRAYLNKVYQPDFSGLCSGEFIVLPEMGAVLGRFLKYRLNSSDFVRFANHLNSGDRPRVDFDQISVFNLLLPPKPEQERIADALDEILSDLDAGVAALERAQAKLKCYRAAVLKAAVEGTLTAKWRAEHPATEPASVLLTRSLAERRRRWEEGQLKKFKEAGKAPPKNWKAKYKAPRLPDTTGLVALPEGCCWASLDQLAHIAGGVTKGQRYSPNETARVVPYLRVANVQRGYLDLSHIKEINALESDIEALTLQPGDVLFNEGGDRDKLGRGWIWEGKIAECIHQNHVFRARLFLNDVSPKLISWCGNSYGQRWFMRTGKQSVNLASINMTVLRSFPVPLAPAAEQEAIVDAAEDQLSVIEHLDVDIETMLKSAQALRQSILRHAFTGLLVRQDPNDEPAAKLLNRIANQREESAKQAARKDKPKPQPNRVTKQDKAKQTHD